MKRWRVYGSAGLAIGLPLALLAVYQTSHFDALCHVAMKSKSAGWVALALIAAFVILEARGFFALARLARVGGDFDCYCALLVDPACVRRRRLRLFRLGAVTLACMVALGVAELSFRILNIQPPAIHPQLEDALAVDNSRNALGIREAWDALPPGDQRLRIAFLGDSFTYGEGVEREEAFPHLVEGLLEGAVPQGVITINLGDPGSNAEHQLALYRRVREAIRPDIVVHVPYLNDLGPGMNARAMIVRIYRLRDEELWLGSFSYVLRYVEKQIRFRLAHERTISYFKGGRTHRQRASSWARFKSEVWALNQSIEGDGAVYCMSLFPCLFELKDYLLHDTHAGMKKLADEMHAPYLDLLEVFEGLDPVPLRVSFGNEHPNPKGHRMAAERIAAWLKKDVLPLVGSSVTAESPAP